MGATNLSSVGQPQLKSNGYVLTYDVIIWLPSRTCPFKVVQGLVSKEYSFVINNTFYNVCSAVRFKQPASWAYIMVIP